MVVAFVVAGFAQGALSFGNSDLAADSNPEPSPSRAPVPSPEPSPSPSPSPEPQPLQFTFVAAGDVLPHAPVINSASTGDGYNFAPLMENVRPYVEEADLAICHLEAPITPPGVAPSGYPRFGAPPDIVDGLLVEGWDGCSFASNHTVDLGLNGLVTTLEKFEDMRMGISGAGRTEEEASQAQTYVVQVGDEQINVANISFTYGLNGLPKPQGMPWAVDTFDADASDAEPIIAAAQAARDAGADIVIASVHCCVEYRTEPTPAQRLLAERIAESGTVDLYVGHHAHVPQPIEKLPGGVYGDGMWTAFGLGNYISNQDTQCCRAETNSGVLLTTTFTVQPEGIVDVDVEWTATTVDRLDSHTMYVLSDVPDGTGRLSAAEVAARHQRVANAVGDQAPERTSPPPALADSIFPVQRTQ